MTDTAAPLAGWRVLVPRGGRWGDDVGAALRTHGGVPVIAPMINFASPHDAQALVDALERLSAGVFDWLVVTSATTVDVLVSQGISVPRSTRIAAVGETTSAVLMAAGYRVEFVPDQDHSARGIVDQWPTSAHAGRVLIPQSDIAGSTLATGLMALGLDVEAVAAYRTIGIPVPENIVSDVAAGRIQALLVTSGSVAREVQRQFAPLPKTTVVACIGPFTASDARAAGIDVDVLARERSARSLVDSLAEFATGLGTGKVRNESRNTSRNTERSAERGADFVHANTKEIRHP